MNLQFVQGDSIFARINKVPRQFSYLDKDIATDVVIVGGGVTGSILGYYLSKNNIKSVILEKNIVGYGSTSITTSLLQYELDSTVRELEQYTSFDNVIRSYRLGLEALGEIKKFVEEYGNNFDYVERDALLYTAKNSDIGQIREEYEIRKENGFDVLYMDEESNPFSFDMKSGVYSVNGGAEIDPYKFTHELLKAGMDNGLKVYENTEVTGVHYNEDGVIVSTKYDYNVYGKIVVVATGYNTHLFSDRSFGTTTTTFNIATKPIKNFDGYYNKVLIRDNKIPYNYLRTTTENRLIIGGGDVNFIPEIYNDKIAKETYDTLECHLKTMFPKIKDIEIEYKYCGAFTSTQDNLGFIGKDPKNEKLWFDLGYGANGILFAILGGQMLSKLYKGEECEDLNLFRVDRFDN